MNEVKKILDEIDERYEDALNHAEQVIQSMLDEKDRAIKNLTERVNMLEADNNTFMDCLEFHNNKLPEHICGSNGFKDIEGASCPRCNYENRKSEDKQLEKRLQIMSEEYDRVEKELKVFKSVLGAANKDKLEMAEIIYKLQEDNEALLKEK